MAGTNSGVGKTSVAAAIIYGLKSRGYSVQPFKIGPDYIDPSYLSMVSKNKTRNLDAWIMGKKAIVKNFVINSKSSFSIIEGVMGYYDGFSGGSNFSSTHHIANLLEAPVVLVLDASKAARSIAATALGFKKFHKNSRISGFILNKIGSKKHKKLCREALLPLKTPILGFIYRDSELKLESRHLGLIPAVEQTPLKNKVKKVAKKISESLDFEKIIEIGKKTSALPKISPTTTKKPKTTIAVALDKSFNFYYEDNFESLIREGARIKFFSPITDKKLPKCDGLYIGGGFPEVLASSLEKNDKMKKEIKKFVQNEAPVYAECGGLMYLSKSINYESKKFSMVGIFDAQTLMTKKMKLNYTEGVVNTNCIISSPLKKIRGHEFHFSKLTSIPRDSKFAYKLTLGDGISNKKDGLIEKNTLASYGHLYFDGAGFAKKFVENCIKFSRK